jgi:DNA-binding NarL/FixJ family response regulator
MLSDQFIYHVTFVGADYVSSNVAHFRNETLLKLKETIKETKSHDFQIDFDVVDTPNHLFPLFSNPAFCTDLIILDMEGILELKGTNPFDVISTISTLAKCTVCRGPGEKTKQRDVILAVGLTTKSDAKLVKLILGTSVNGIYPEGPDFTIDEKVNAIVKLLNHENYIPKRIKEIINPAKKCKNDGGIKLTPRQEQVLSLIRERGSSNKSIGKILKISESAVKLHVSHILKLYGVKIAPSLFCSQIKSNIQVYTILFVTILYHFCF